MRPSRRNVLLGAGGLVVVGGVTLALPPVRRGLCGSPEDAYRQQSLARLGEACVACRAYARGDVERQWSGLSGLDDGQLQAAIAEDFAAARIVSIDGWLLSATEVTIYAAAHFGLVARRG